MTAPTQPAPNIRSKLKDALLWAILAALVSQDGEIYLLARTLWQRLDKAEIDLHQIENDLHSRPGAR